MIGLRQSLAVMFIKHWLTMSLGIVTYLTIITALAYTSLGRNSTIDFVSGKPLSHRIRNV